MLVGFMRTVTFFAAAYVLDPEFVDHDQASNAEVMEGFGECLGKIGMLLQVRRLNEQGKFTLIWKQRLEEMRKDLTKTHIKNYPVYPSATSDQEVRSFCAAAHAQGAAVSVSR